MGEYDLAMQDFHMWVLRAPESGDAYFIVAVSGKSLIWLVWRFLTIGLRLRINPFHETARSALAELMRDSTVNRPKTIFSLAALFAGDGPAPDSK